MADEKPPIDEQPAQLPTETPAPEPQRGTPEAPPTPGRPVTGG